MKTLPAFTAEQADRAKRLLAARVASMMGRKMEEGDWSKVYCEAKGIPEEGWSNLHIDVNHEGLGVEFKMLRVTQLRGKPIKAICGTTLMHPAATRSIRIDDVSLPADQVMKDVLKQYSKLIDSHTRRVQDRSSDGSADMRFGWLLWEDNLREFLYFEETMWRPNPRKYHATWHETAARGARKASKSLWIFEKKTGAKRFSVTTSAGIKIQPYFDVPPPNDMNLNYFRVQSEPIGDDVVVLWVSAVTAARLERHLGSIDKDTVSNAVTSAAALANKSSTSDNVEGDLAVPIRVSKNAFDVLVEHWDAVSDDHRIQQLIDSLTSAPAP